MAMTLTLTIAESEMLRSIALGAKCTADDVKLALGRCPGAPIWDDIVPNKYDMETLTDTLLERVGRESPYLPFSFLLRLMEQTWASDAVRRGITSKLPSLVRPPRRIAGQVDALVNALSAMPKELPVLTPGVAVNDLFRRLCEARGDIQKMVDSLKLFAALKAIHDSLHTLQVLGAEWLDALAKRGAQATSTAPLLALLSRVISVTTQPADKLPPDIVESSVRCREASVDADKRLRGGNQDEIAFACSALRGMLMHEPPLIDAAMFAVSREFPLVQFCTFFDDATAREAAFDLGDTIRRRLMEHALWQATDQGLYQIEQILAHPPSSLTGELVARFPWTRSYLSVLFDAPTSQRVIPPMNDAVTRYVLAADGHLPDGMAAASLEDICAAFGNLRSAARSAFLDVDQALKEDFSRLLKLQEPLEAILLRVPDGCRIFLL